MTYHHETRARKGDNRRLTTIAGQIKTLEKRTLANIVDIGRLLEQASEIVEHGEYADWLKINFGWSYSTSSRYRAIYRLSQNRQIGDFAKLDMSVSALHLLAENVGQAPVCEALVAAAQKGRVSYSQAMRIVDDIKRAAEADAKAASKAPAILGPETDGAADAGNADAADKPDPQPDPQPAESKSKPRSKPEPGPEPRSASPQPAAMTTAVPGDPEALLRLLLTTISAAKKINAAKLVERVGLSGVRALVNFLRDGLNECSVASAAREQANAATTARPSLTGHHSIKDAADRAEARSKIAAFEDLEPLPSYLDRRKLN